MEKKSILIVCAMRKESKLIAEKLKLEEVEKNIFKNDNYTLLISGIGKQKTAISLTKYLCNNEKPDIIVNVGYAGSTDIEIGSWVNINKVYNLEWEIPGEEKYSFEDCGNQELVCNKELKSYQCYSSESFVTSTDLTGHIVFDMELHSIATVCDMYNIPLVSYKKISDNLSYSDYSSNTENNKNVFELDSVIKFF